MAEESLATVLTQHGKNFKVQLVIQNISLWSRAPCSQSAESMVKVIICGEVRLSKLKTRGDQSLSSARLYTEGGGGLSMRFSSRLEIIDQKEQ